MCKVGESSTCQDAKRERERENLWLVGSRLYVVGSAVNESKSAGKAIDIHRRKSPPPGH